MKKTFILIFICAINFMHSQKVLTSWSQQNIENYTKEMYDEAQKLTYTELLNKNLTDKSWSEVFLTLNASINNYKTSKEYLYALANQITNNKVTKLQGTSRLVIWDRITTGEIIFEGKGLVIENDLFKVSGRANQILQNLTNKNFGYISINSNDQYLLDLKSKWLKYLNNENVAEYIENECKNCKIPEITSLNAIEALIISLQENPEKNLITKNCLKKVYNLDDMPTDKNSSAVYCNPDTYTFTYLGMLFGDEKIDKSKDAIWWKNFWKTNNKKIIWNDEKGFFVIK